jgi:GT2 family glycosyltransferase
VRPAVYVTNYEGRHLLERVLNSLQAQTRQADLHVVDNGSSDGSAEFLRERFPDVGVIELGRNFGFGSAVNRAVEAQPGDPFIVLNNDLDCRPDFLAEMLDAATDGAATVAGVLLKEREPEVIDSAGVVVDRTVMSFDYLNSEPVSALDGAPPPLGPTGGAALYRLDPFRAAGGFDERIFLSNEDVDLAIRLAAVGGRCRLAAGARALHAYSATIGAGSGWKYSSTGWSRGYMLRRYGAMSSPRAVAHVLACEGTICAGQVLLDHTAKGLLARLRGWRDGAGLERRETGDAELLDISTREALHRRRRRRG